MQPGFNRRIGPVPPPPDLRRRTTRHPAQCAWSHGGKSLNFRGICQVRMQMAYRQDQPRRSLRITQVGLLQIPKGTPSRGSKLQRNSRLWHHRPILPPKTKTSAGWGACNIGAGLHESKTQHMPRIGSAPCKNLSLPNGDQQPICRLPAPCPLPCRDLPPTRSQPVPPVP